MKKAFFYCIAVHCGAVLLSGFYCVKKYFLSGSSYELGLKIFNGWNPSSYGVLYSYTAMELSIKKYTNLIHSWIGI